VPTLLDAVCDVVVHDRVPQRVDELVAFGARPAADPRTCAGAVDLLLTSLPEPRHVRDVMLGAGALAALRHGAV
jgi:2-hydroxy-3-oxopropionate reductase